MSERDDALELYKVFVETITASEQRRQNLSAFYTSLIAGSAAFATATKEADPLWLVVAVFVVSTIWLLTMRYFRRLASAKFAVIRQMEPQFSTQPFAEELRYFMNRTSKEGKTLGPRRFAWTLTHFDQVIPALAATGSLVYLLGRLFLWICN